MVLFVFCLDLFTCFPARDREILSVFEQAQDQNNLLCSSFSKKSSLVATSSTTQMFREEHDSRWAQRNITRSNFNLTEWQWRWFASQHTVRLSGSPHELNWAWYYPNTQVAFLEKGSCSLTVITAASRWLGRSQRPAASADLSPPGIKSRCQTGSVWVIQLLRPTFQQRLTVHTAQTSFVCFNGVDFVMSHWWAASKKICRHMRAFWLYYRLVNTRKRIKWGLVERNKGWWILE